MANRRTRTTGRNVAAGIAVAGVVGLGLLTVPAGAGAAPELPPVTAEELAQSVSTAQAGAFSGTVELDNALGLPALPGVPQAANGTSTARVWSDGAGAGRVQLPTDSGERTLVSDGETFWAWDSETRTVVTTTGRTGQAPPEAAATDPTTAAAAAVAALRDTSQVSVDGTAEVAGRPAYELVLSPAPAERTLLREVRIAVDAQRRVPLRLTVLANGSTEPVLQIGFTELEFAGQDPALFTFVPPPGAIVEQPEQAQEPLDGKRAELAGAAPAIVGDGWDTVVVATMPAPDTAPDTAPGAGPADGDRFGGPDAGGLSLDALGTPVSGAWGSGRLISTAVATAIVTDDGRIAAGAVPEQVLTEALSR